MDTSFQISKQGKDEWLTPQSVLYPLGQFDLDPCAPIKRPWPTATKHYTILDNGLIQDWNGRVWLNPPYGPETSKWLLKLASHNNGIALVFSRTDVVWFHKIVFKHASAILFLEGRIRFHHVSGLQGGTPGCGSVLIAFGAENAISLQNSKLKGKFIQLNKD